MATFYYVGEDVKLPEKIKNQFTAQQLSAKEVIGFDANDVKSTDKVVVYETLADAQRVAKAKADPSEKYQFMVYEVTTDKTIKAADLPIVKMEVDEIDAREEEVTAEIAAREIALSALKFVSARFEHLDTNAYYYNNYAVQLNLTPKVKVEAPASAQDKPVDDKAPVKAAAVVPADKAAPVVADKKEEKSAAKDAAKPALADKAQAPVSPITAKKAEEAKKTAMLSTLFAKGREFLSNNRAGLLFGAATGVMFHLSAAPVAASLVAAKATWIPVALLATATAPLTLSVLAGAAVFAITSLAARLNMAKPLQPGKLTEQARYQNEYKSLKKATKQERRELGYIRSHVVKTAFTERLNDVKDAMDKRPLFTKEGAFVATEERPRKDKLTVLTQYKQRLDAVKALKVDAEKNSAAIEREERMIVRGERVRRVKAS